MFWRKFAIVVSVAGALVFIAVSAIALSSTPEPQARAQQIRPTPGKNFGL